jgi:hypothetical protein
MTRLPEKRMPAASTVPRGAIRKMLPGGARDRLQGRDTRAGHSPGNYNLARAPVCLRKPKRQCYGKFAITNSRLKRRLAGT